MERVKVTQEQADSIEWQKKEARRAHERQKNNPQRNLDGRLHPLLELSTDDYMVASFEGYEVEPEFKVGDWVTAVHSDLENRSIGQILSIIENRIYAKWTVFGDEITISQGHYNLVSSMIEHATPEEIATEKQRRFFARNGRKPWELREDDVLEYLGDLLIIDSIRFEDIYFKSNKENIPNYMENLDYVKEHFKVICFAEDRKDM